MALARGEAEISGCHLWDEVTGEYNSPFVLRLLPNRPIMLLTLAKRIQGLIVPPGNPRGLEALADLQDSGVRLINRQPGSGTRVWLDVQLKAAGVDPSAIEGYESEETTHLAIARAVAEGRADVGLGVSAAAAAYCLDFIPLGEERYDLVVPLELWEEASLMALREVVASARFKEAVLALGGYDVTETGAAVRVG